jgi:hypothetical protein
MEIYAYTLQSNITIDVKKKKGGGTSQCRNRVRRQARTTGATSTRTARQEPNLILFSEHCTRNMETYVRPLHHNITSDVKKKKGGANHTSIIRSAGIKINIATTAQLIQFVERAPEVARA